MFKNRFVRDAIELMIFDQSLLVWRLYFPKMTGKQGPYQNRETASHDWSLINLKDGAVKSISTFLLIGSMFHVTLRIFGPELLFK